MVRSALPVLGVAVTLASGCGPDDISGGDGTESSGAQDSSMSAAEESDPECPDLVLDDSLFVRSVEEAQATALYTHVTGRVGVVHADGLLDLSFLRCLQRVDGDLTIWDSPDLETAVGLERLERVHDLKVTENPALVSLEALESLRVIEDYGLVDYNASMQVVGLRSLESVARLEIGHYCLSGNPSLIELGLDSLAEFDVMLVGNNHALTSIDSLDGLAARMENAPHELDDPGYAMGFFENENLPIEQVQELADEVYGDGSQDLLTCGNANEETCESMDPEWELKCLSGV